MTSSLVHILYPLLLLFLLLLLQFVADTRAYSNVSLGSSLYAIDDNSSWASPSGDFAFGFRRFPGKEDQFLLSIWFAKIPDETIVWSANGKYPMQRESKVELTTTGQLVVTAPGGWELWKTKKLKDNGIRPSHATMLDTGNFVIVSKNTRSIWESFKHPTNTILPSQVLRSGGNLSSTILENDYSPGKFELRLLENGNLLLNQIDIITTNPYQPYFAISNVSEVVFNESGYIHIRSRNGSISNLTTSFVIDREVYHRATLNFDGTFIQYSHPKTQNGNGNESWSAVKTIPLDICQSIMDYFGSGPCGYNSFCQLGSDSRPICGCPPGFSPLDSGNRYSGCKYEYSSLGQDCNKEGSIIQEDRFDFVKVDGADWPLAAYEQLYPSTVFECEKSCLRDCYCAVAIFRPPNSTNSGTCWKKRLPLSNGRLDRTAVERSALFKVLKYNSSSQKLPNRDSGKERQTQVTIILSVLLGTSVLINFLSVAAILLSGFWLCHRKLATFCRILNARDLDMNLHCFTYRELQEATNGFTEELGRGAFGTVYKGVLDAGSVRHVAVKKLEKVVQEGEKEFKTEVSVIGRTHHKNLVRLLGYCDESQHRLLVYEFMHNGSLSSFLFGVMRPSWHQRVQIAFGIARGLMYLHEECSTQIIHCDIKPQNILLDDSFTAKISDFGLAKLLMNNQTRTLTGIRGTKGYVAPEWFRNTPVSVKIDVYSFGVMLLEIICCRRCVEPEMEKAEILTDWAYECFSKGRVEELVKDDEEARGDLKKLEKMVMVALWCVNDEPQLRPSMRVITLMLEGILEVHVPPCPFPLSSMSFHVHGRIAL